MNPKLNKIRSCIKAIGFDFFGTLVEAKANSMECVLSMCKYLQKIGYEFSDEDFIRNYHSVVESFRKLRNDDLREVNNCVWVAYTLKKMGYEVELSSPYIISAVDRYFDSWQITLASDATEVLKLLKGKFTVSLISNFTDSTFLHRSLKRLEIEEFFDHVIDSDSIGWRKPHPEIFKRFLKLSAVRAEEAIFIGDELESDIKGAKILGINTVLLARPGIRNFQEETEACPDHIVNSLTEFVELLLSNT